MAISLSLSHLELGFLIFFVKKEQYASYTIYIFGCISKAVAEVRYLGSSVVLDCIDSCSLPSSFISLENHNKAQAHL